MSMLAELQPIYLTGDFSLENMERGWKIVPNKPLSIGSWKEQGYPFYSGRVKYTKQQTFSGSPGRAVVRLGEWKGTVAEVLVNGRHAGIIQQPPYQTEITSLLSEGSNTIEVIVYGSNKNLMGPHHNITRRGITTPWDFISAPDIQPPGVEYDLFDYGLMNDFTILVSD